MAITNPLTSAICVVCFYHNKTMFGQLIKQLRSQKRLGLREFCIAASYDPSNWSKIERGMLPPPQDQDVLNRIVAILGVSETSKERDLIFDYAAIDAGKIPQYVLEDAELVKRLPLFFRTAKGKKPTKEELITLAEILRTA
jgi:transcriptional regulator with XRE-family HTH domain